MFAKPVFLIAAAGVATVMALSAAPAAKADSVQFGVTIGDGPGWGGPRPGPGWRRPPPPPPAWGGYYDDPPPPRHFGGAYGGYGYGMSCGQAANVARNAGFRGVRATDCSPPVYEFEGWRRGRLFSIDVSRNGRIVSMDPIY